jgi:alkylhydroperoxidase/carboxymuconolactone decarboxylase family protein YurZ
MAAVLDGRPLYARRDELQQVIEITDAAASAALADVIREHAHGGVDAARDIEEAMAAAARVAAGDELPDDVAARLACALTDPQVRDTLYALAVGDGAAQAEALWAVLSRMLPAPWRAEALVLLAFSAYARGDGPLAGVSLEAALACDPTHRMAGMLDTALQSGIRPEQIRELAATGYRLAKRLGIELPRQQRFGRRAG